LAQQEVDAQAQAHANSWGGCTGGIVPYSSRAVGGTFTRNCPAGQTSDPVTYSVPAGAFTSPDSQLAADNLALAYLQTQGAAYAEANGTPCAYKIGFETEISVDDVANRIQRIRFYNGLGVLKYDIGANALLSPNFVNRDYYKIVVDVSGVTYNNLTLRMSTSSTSTSNCQYRTGTGTASYEFDFIDLSPMSIIYFKFLLSATCE
jgi:Family of unknown function (DUF5977)